MINALSAFNGKFINKVILTLHCIDVRKVNKQNKMPSEYMLAFNALVNNLNVLNALNAK